MIFSFILSPTIRDTDKILKSTKVSDIIFVVRPWIVKYKQVILNSKFLDTNLGKDDYRIVTGGSNCIDPAKLHSA